MIVQRGVPPPPSYHTDRLREAHGAMYSIADRVQPEDRWAIAAYLRALQRSQHATLRMSRRITGKRYIDPASSGARGLDGGSNRPPWRGDRMAACAGRIPARSAAWGFC